MSISLLLLQAGDSAIMAAAALATPPPAVEQISLLHLMKEGGILMIPLLICSLIMVYVFIERFMAIRKASVNEQPFMARLREEIRKGDIAGAKLTCKNANTPLSRIIEKGISRIGKPLDYVEKSMENSGRLEIYQMEKNLSVLSTIAGIAPIFGFLGTIAGMIILFFNVQHQGFSLPTIAGGIYTKMVTSAAGLIIGMLAYLCYTYLNAQINKTVNKFEAASVEFLDLLQDTQL